MKKNQGALFCG